MRIAVAVVGALAVLVGACATPRTAVHEDVRATAHDEAPFHVELPRTGPIKIVALGDTGKGNAGQRAVADAVAALCRAEGGCHLGLLLGDNVYPNGLDDAFDPRFDTLIEDVYGPLGFPFLMVLGNHDYGSPVPWTLLGGLGLEERRAEAQIARSRRSSHVRAPARHWRMRLERLELVGLDTPTLFFDSAPFIAGGLGFTGDARVQDEHLRRWNAEPRSVFRIALGHHPLRSAGPHGDAGRYEGIPFEALWLAGGGVRAFLESRVAGHFDLYLSGHDHGLQDAGDVDGTALFVSGGGAEHKPHPRRTQVPFVQEALGFIVVDVTGTRARVRIFAVPDAGGAATLVHERTVARAPG